MSEQAPGAVLVEAGHGEYTLGPLTIEDVDALTGRELDAAVARYVMGWDVVRTNGVAWYGRYPGCKFSTEDVPNYSRDMAAAWLVIERLRDLWTVATEGVAGWDNSFTSPFRDDLFFDTLHRHADRRWPWAMLYLEPAVICRTAVEAMLPITED